MLTQDAPKELKSFTNNHEERKTKETKHYVTIRLEMS